MSPFKSSKTRNEGKFIDVFGSWNAGGSTVGRNSSYDLYAGPLFSQFTITLNGGSASRLGDDSSTVNSFWSSVTSPLLINKGTQSYTGYYAATLSDDAICDFTVGGAAGCRNTNGRSISARFTLTAGTRLVFFAGKPGTMTTGSSNQEGGAGGASCVMVHDGSNLVPYIIAAGGSSSYSSRSVDFVARPLSETNNSTIATARNNRQSNSGNTTGAGGVGRGAAGSAQSGGAGWGSGALLNNGNGDPDVADSLATGARGGNGISGDGDGGFGGGGGDQNGNSYGAGGGGYWGGWETAASGSSAGGSYKAYTNSQSDFVDNNCGPMSYVRSTGSSNVSDNGLYGTISDSNTPTAGTIQIQFTPVT